MKTNRQLANTVSMCAKIRIVIGSDDDNDDDHDDDHNVNKNKRNTNTMTGNIVFILVSSPRGIGHRVGILTFSKKNYQNSHPQAKKNCQN